MPNQKHNPRRWQDVSVTFSLIFAFLFIASEILACTVPQQWRFPSPSPTLPGIATPGDANPATPDQTSAGPVVRDIVLNTGVYPNGNVPRYAKLEITFQVDTTATSLQWPYDPAPPPGIQAGSGISVDAQFTPDNWQTVYNQPAFYYQEFEDSIKSGKEWFYPTKNYSWKVRFAPDKVGAWQFKLVARDAGGISESAPMQFTVVSSVNKGFVRVSARDPRYFEFDNGGYFPGLGYNMNYDHVRWTNPVLDNESNFQAMSQNGIQLVRIWLSQWSIYGLPWNPWNSIDPQLHGLYIPYAGTTFSQSYPGSEVSMRLDAAKNPCMAIGFMQAPPAVRPNTRYRVRIRYLTEELAGPRLSGFSYGFTAKTGGWLWEAGNRCHDPGTGQIVTSYQSQNTATWQTLEGSLVTGNTNFLPLFYLVLENVNQGKVYVDYVWIEEDLGNGVYGANIVSKPWMAHHLYMEQRNSYAFDKVVSLAEEYGVYLRPVILEKNDWIFNRIDNQGQPIVYDPLCDDGDPGNDPVLCPSNNWFYGNRREMTKVRWLQQTWWRYLQARWGYSTSIHSWELLNEGDPANELHYTLADEFGKYMHQFAPNQHMVSTSFWHSFPKNAFWANPAYADVDFADIHMYIEESAPGFIDTAFASFNLSQQVGAKQSGGAGKPVIRGETGFTVSGSEPHSPLLLADTDAIWLHNFIWAGINPGGLIESYWYEDVHIYSIRGNGQVIFDHRPHYRTYSNFIQGVSLNNGFFQDLQATVSNDQMRVLGQKDLTNGRAHLWIQNVNHTWKNIVDGVPIPGVSGTIRMEGFQPGELYTLQWWDTYQPEPSQQVIRMESITAAADGAITITVSSLVSDIAIKVSPNAPVSSDFQVFIPLVIAP